MLLGTVDTLIAGRLSVRALDAVALGNVWQVCTMMPLVGVIFGLDPLVSQAHGAGRGRDVGLALQRALLIAVVLSAPIAIAWSYTAEGLVLLGQDPELAREAAVFVSVQRFCAPGLLTYGALSTYLVSRGIVRPGIAAMVVANLFNGVMSWSLTFGALGLPALGIRGLGISTGLTRLLLPCALALLIVSLELHANAWTPWSKRIFGRAALGRQLALGIPTGITLALELWAFSFGTVIAGRIGHVALGAHAIALNLSALSFMVPLGFSIGTSARVGLLIGAQAPERAQRAAHTALKLIATYSLCAGVLFVLARGLLPMLYSRDPAIVAAAASVLPIAGAFQLFDGLQATGGGVLRGMGKPRVTALVNLVGYFAIAIPFAYYSGLSTSLGIAGIWLGYAAGLLFTAAALVGQVLWRGPSTVAPLPPG
jgi:MATE family multidrug resistance protein